MAAEGSAVTIYVVSHGWHTGIVVPRREIPDSFWRGDKDFPEAEFLEFGWGDERFYRAAKPGVLELLEAALLPSAAVLHVVGFRGPATEFFPASGVVAVRLERDAFYRLARFMDKSLLKPRSGEVSPLGSGLYGHSHFYAAHGKYTVFNNCNHWVARGLHAAGLAVDPDDALTASAVFDQARAVGTILRPEP